MGLHEAIEVKEFSVYGFTCRGVFARARIAAGERVWWLVAGEEASSLVLTRDEIIAHPQSATLQTYSYMIGMDEYETTLTPERDPSWFFNHTCDPNCGYVSAELIVALRDIEPGEQVAYDYAFTETEASFHAGMQCGCGTAACRGKLEFSEYRSPAFVRKWRQCLSPHVKARAEERSWFDPRVYPCKIDALGGEFGLRALSTIGGGEVVLVFAGKIILDKYAIDTRQCDERAQELSLQVHDHLYQVPIGAFRGASPKDSATDEIGVEVPDLINHSCDANCGQLDSVTLVAMREIAAGEQLTFDYAMSSTAPGLVVDPFTCRCGAKTCRGRVQPGDWMRPEIQDRYWPYFAPHMKSRILAKRPDLAKVGPEKRNGHHHHHRSNGMEVNGSH